MLNAVIAGLVVAAVIVWGIRQTGAELKPWGYPLTLATFPLFYIAFAWIASDFQALQLELVYALPFFVLCVFSLGGLGKAPIAVYILAVAYLLHAGYDIIHHNLVINAGTPLWWPAFCAVVDMAVAMYLFWFAAGLPKPPADGASGGCSGGNCSS